MVVLMPMVEMRPARRVHRRDGRRCAGRRRRRCLRCNVCTVRVRLCAGGHVGLGPQACLHGHKRRDDAVRANLGRVREDLAQVAKRCGPLHRPFGGFDGAARSGRRRVMPHRALRAVQRPPEHFLAGLVALELLEVLLRVGADLHDGPRADEVRDLLGALDAVLVVLVASVAAETLQEPLMLCSQPSAFVKRPPAWTLGAGGRRRHDGRRRRGDHGRRALRHRRATRRARRARRRRGGLHLFKREAVPPRPGWVRADRLGRLRRAGHEAGPRTGGVNGRRLLRAHVLGRQGPRAAEGPGNGAFTERHGDGDRRGSAACAGALGRLRSFGHPCPPYVGRGRDVGLARGGNGGIRTRRGRAAGPRSVDALGLARKHSRSVRCAAAAVARPERASRGAPESARERVGHLHSHHTIHSRAACQ